VILSKQLEMARHKLGGLPNARLEAEILLAYVLDSPRSFLYANPELGLPYRRVHAFRKLIKRRLKGEPIAYITGTREFWSLKLRITRDVLIPRHETELLVETALEKIPYYGTLRIADLGTGSGAIALALASERPSVEVTATDISQAAIELARENAGDLNLGNVRFQTGSWCEPLEGSFNVIVSNPPYIAADDPHLKQGDCRFEPGQALTPGEDSLCAFRIITEQASSRLAENGWLIFEHGLDQGPDIQEILSAAGYADIETLSDLSGHPRVTLGRM
jgi:release factor glutamine methyltransferase